MLYICVKICIGYWCRQELESKRCTSCHSTQLINALQSPILTLLAIGTGAARVLLNKYNSHFRNCGAILSDLVYRFQNSKPFNWCMLLDYRTLRTKGGDTKESSRNHRWFCKPWPSFLGCCTTGEVIVTTIMLGLVERNEIVEGWNEILRNFILVFHSFNTNLICSSILLNSYHQAQIFYEPCSNKFSVS